MWPKDDYQEHMLGYLDGVRTEIERLEQSRIYRNDTDELFDDLEIALEQLWWLIEANDVEWEGFRYTLEASCDDLLRNFYRVPSDESLIFSVRLTLTEKLELVT
jgi:hypothetical protein